MLNSIIRMFKMPQDLSYIQFKKINTYTLCITSILLLIVSIWGNTLQSHSEDLMFILYMITIFLIICTVCLYFNKISILFLKYFSLGALALFSICLLTVQDFDTRASLVWFIIFPPMIMFTMGLRHGTFFFLSYTFMLAILFFSDLNQYLNLNLTAFYTSRLLLAMIGAFVYSWCLEYVRHKTKKALTIALMHSEKTSSLDTLTGLRNRRNFNESITAIIENTKNTKTSFALAFMDLDHFKKVNDTYGHNIGDNVLQHMAAIFNSQKSVSDLLFRWGGEEFLLVLPMINKNEVKHIFNRIRIACEQTPYTDAELSLVCTISIGYYVSDGKESIQNILKFADQNLYKAKNTGRNCVTGNG